jgi:thiol-disulfide isomerase/thioredoxin
MWHGLVFVLASMLPTFPSLSGATAWLNSPPLTPAALRGKVVLVEFWTYTCVNWERTLPYVRAWAARYKTDGFVVIGVHTPEFSFEKNLDNIRRAMQGDRIDYPVAVDSDYAIWNAFDNNYWPALYLIDAEGHIRYHHFGEGAYEASESEIRQLLSDAGHHLNGPTYVSVDPVGLEVAADWDDVKSGETYLGSDRTTNFVSPAPTLLPLNSWAVSGDWKIGREAIELNRADGTIVFQFHARDLNLIMGPTRPGTSVRFRVRIDGHPPGNAHGVDADANGDGVVSEQRTYQLIRQPKPIVDRRFEIEFFGPGIQAFDVTFG